MRSRVHSTVAALGLAAAAAVAACGSSSSHDANDGGSARDGSAGATSDAAVTEGSADAAPTDPGPFPLGATFGTYALHFRVRSDPALALEVDLYATAMGKGEVLRVPMTRSRPSDPWGADVSLDALAAAGLTGPVYYGYRAFGPNWTPDPTWTKGSSAGFVSDVDGSGNRFNPNKLLIDPYARELSHDPLEPGSTSSSPYESGPSRAMDDGQLAPKSIVWPSGASGFATPPSRPFKDDVIYEVHVRGLTMNDTSVPSALRGTYAGAAAKAGALAALGVTAIEFLPIHETQNDLNDMDPQSANYWGYSTIAYFAPDRRYASDKSSGGPTREFLAMVSAFHTAGIKVFLDVVYNHTAEGGPSGSNVGTAKIFSLRGLDNAGYYELAADHASAVDNTGTGQNTNAASEVFRNLVIDSLHYWHDVMGVDGFRFDLAAVLGNTCSSVCFAFGTSDPNGILPRAATEFPGVPLIAEPWGATGAGTYQLGSFPPGWSEWNGTFRDDIRTAQNQLGQVDVTPTTIGAKTTGSPDLFNHDGRPPSASINYVDCHDGFTLHDEYAYDAPLNDQAYPLGPSSGGSTANDSWDQNGAAAAQEQAARTGLALVLLSSGVPMFQGGDEMLRTQYGNNNAYNLDDQQMWLDPTLATTNASFASFTTALLAFRAAHESLRPASFLSLADPNGGGLPQVAFLDNTGAVATSAYMVSASSHFLAWRLDGTGAGDSVRSIYIAYNAWSSNLSVTVPAPSATTAWYVAGDTAAGTWAAVGSEPPFAGNPLSSKARSVVVLVER